MQILNPPNLLSLPGLIIRLIFLPLSQCWTPQPESPGLNARGTGNADFRSGQRVDRLARPARLPRGNCLTAKETRGNAETSPADTRRWPLRCGK